MLREELESLEDNVRRELLILGCAVEQVETADYKEDEVVTYEEEFGLMIKYEESVASVLTKEEELCETKFTKVEPYFCTMQPLKEDEVSPLQRPYTNELIIVVKYVLVKSMEDFFQANMGEGSFCLSM